MARKVPGPPSGVVRRFVPQALGNSKDSDPVAVDILQPTEEERREMFRAGRAAMVVGKDGNVEKRPDGSAKIVLDPSELYAWQRVAIERFVQKVLNYTSSTGAPIDNGVDLWKHGEPEFVTEIADEVLSRTGLGSQEKKLSGEPSGSSTQMTPPLDGTAESADRAA